jgi:hypothetical protein
MTIEPTSYRNQTQALRDAADVENLCKRHDLYIERRASGLCCVYEYGPDGLTSCPTGYITEFVLGLPTGDNSAHAARYDIDLWVRTFDIDAEALRHEAEHAF